MSTTKRYNIRKQHTSIVFFFYFLRHYRAKMALSSSTPKETEETAWQKPVRGAGNELTLSSLLVT